MFINANLDNQVNFNGFAKFKGTKHEVEKTTKLIKEALPDSFVFSDKNKGKKKTCFILTDNHQTNFLNLLDEVEISDLKVNIEKYLGEKAEKLSLKKINKQLKKNEFKI